MRLIPAHAGKTDKTKLPVSRCGAHPRSRGENASVEHTVMPTRGSSPLTRGKPGRGLGRRGLARLIPAHAGKTTPRRSLEASRKAHPRSRGENDPSGSVSHSHPGSSPLTRGKRRLTGVHAWRRGLIPAHAGKTDERELEGLRSAAHPRSRGENCDAVGHVVADGGSSPLTRGKHSGRRELPDGPRLIPAHAGKTTERSRP